MEYKKIETPLSDEIIKTLRSGDQVFLSGTIYTARDSAHKLLLEIINKNEELPFDLIGSVIYYVGPSPARPGSVIGAAGPTTSYRMDPFTPVLLRNGLKGMIGKGSRSEEVKNAIKGNRGVYFCAIGGAAALISKSIIEAEVIAFKELGTEAVRRLVVKDMPLIVINDSYGGDLYTEGVAKYRI